MDVDIGGMRKPYKSKSDILTEDKLTSREPMEQFNIWFNEACKCPDIIEANAVCLATCTKDGYPSSRMVLLKGYDANGFKFYTNYNSRKGKEIEENPNVALTFYWAPLNKSIRIEGTASKLTTTESDSYFNSRPLPSQIGAIISPQSQVVESRNVLDKKVEELEKKYSVEYPPTRPEYWGGYLVKPTTIEFWQGQSNRVHDRIRFRLLEKMPDAPVTREKQWFIDRLAP